jgi:hypothetical protein
LWQKKIDDMPVDFAQISSTTDQRPDTTDPVKVEMNQNDAISGIEHVSDSPADIRIADSGVYVIVAAPQVGRKSGTEARFVDFWWRRNGRDVQNSAVRVVVGNSKEKTVIVNQSMMPLEAGDTLNFMMCVETRGEGLGVETLRPTGRPAIPSIIVSMLKIKEAAEGHWITTQKGTGRVWNDEAITK